MVQDFTRDELDKRYPHHVIAYNIGDYDHLATNTTTGMWYCVLDTHRTLYRGPYDNKADADKAWRGKWKVHVSP